MNESSAKSGWAFPADGIRTGSSMAHLMTFLSFSSENRCENAFRPRQPTWPLCSRIGCGLTVKERSEAERADARVVWM